MPKEKRVVQDIVPTHKRTIRSVPPPRRVEVEELEDVERVPIRKITSTTTPTMARISRTTPPPPRRPLRTPSNPSGRRFPSILLTFLIIFIGIAIIAVALSLLYSKAAVTITPKTAHIEVNGTFTAKKVGDSTLGTGALSYETLTATETASQNVPSKEGALIESKAKGTVMLYNEQPTQQKIVAGTRLSNVDNEVYRTTETVVIPAKTTSAGSVGVSVVADAAGAQYNMSATSEGGFKVVAYKGTPKYTTVYAKLKTPITGGFSGKKTTVAPDVLSATVTSLKESLAVKLVDSIKQQTTKDVVFYNNSYTIDYDVSEPVSKSAVTADVVVTGTITAATFKKNTFLKSIAARELDKFPAPSYDTEGLEDLKFTIVNAKDFSARKGTPLIFSLKGSMDLVGTFSEKALKDELKGTYLKDSNTVFARYPSIANAYALITPFWMRSFPNTPEKIIIEIKK